MASFQYRGFEGGASERPRRASDLEYIQRYLGVELSDSSEGSEDLRQSSARSCAWPILVGTLLIVGAFLLGYFAPGQMQLRGVPAGQAAHARVSEGFGEKVLVSVPSTTAMTAETTVTAAAVASAATTESAATAALTAIVDPMSSTTLSGTLNPLLPVEDLHDGNVCRDDEELFAGLCYRKCSLLTNGTDAIRTSPWTCCESHPCTTNQKASVGIQVACTGYDVAGSGVCPHKPGSCLADEELFLGMCYKQCNLLTDGQYPHRVTPVTCCHDSGLNCLDFRKDYTSKEFAVGGGQSGPGACGESDELFLGLCYKSCSMLTHSEYPHRVSAVTCCKANSRLPHKVRGVWHLGCLNFLKDKTSAAFNTAAQAKHGASALQHSHYPLTSLTESGNDTVLRE